MRANAMWRSAGLLALVGACHGSPEESPAGAREGGVVHEDAAPHATCEGPLAAQPVILDCDTAAGYEIDSFRADAVEGPALHLAAVYQTHGNHGFGDHPPGDALVTWKLPGEHVLALSAYEPVHWKIEVAPGAALQKVVVFGYHEQTVDAPPGVAVEAHFALDNQPGDFAVCGYSLPDDGQGCDTEQLIADAEALTGLELASYDGCYDASHFEFAGCAPEPDACTSPLADAPAILDCNTAIGYEVDSFRADAVEPGPVLHIGGIYESHGDHDANNHPPGAATVDWELPGDNVLALTSYEPVHWTIDIADGAGLQKVVVFGFHEQTVTAPPGVEVQTFSALAGDPVPGACGYALPSDGQGCDTEALIAGIEQVTGLKAASFDGCYQATQLRFASACEPDTCVPAAGSEVILDCDEASGYVVDSWRADAAEGPAVHLLGVYDPNSHNAGHPPEEADVYFDLPGDNILALSAYEPTSWRVTLGPGASLSEIVVFGYHEQQVVQEGDIPVQIHSAAQGQESPHHGCGYSLPYNGEGCDTDQLIAHVQTVTGHPVTAFDGCYDAGQFYIGPADDACEPPM